MLIELRIQNFAVIRDLSVEVGSGLNVLTGETGAGKSIIVGALSLLLGERASSESVRTGADRAVVEAVYDLTSEPQLRARLEELGLTGDEEFLVLRREVHSEGRNRAWVNESPATAGTVGELGRVLVDLHGQHEHQTLLRTADQRSILDAFAGAEDLSSKVEDLYGRLARLRSELEDRHARREELAAREDFLRFQLQEIEEARPEPGEDREVEEELARLDHAEELARETEAVHQLLYSRDGAVSETLARARDILRRLVGFDGELAPLGDRAEELYHQVVELGRSAGDYASRVEVSPSRTEELRGRSDLLFRLKRKYGPTLDEVLAARDRLRGQMAELEGAGFESEALERRVREAESELRDTAAELTERRSEAGVRLAEEVEGLLPELGLPGARFAVRIEELESPEAGGAERIRFVTSLNPGFELRPLARIASGGEMSRVMLALKSILARQDRVPTLVFDEIDAGIGGEVAVAVARKLRDVANHHQVFVITHLPQLASQGDHHLRVEKGEQDGVALTTVRRLVGEERIREIARMLGGDPDSATSRDHARELLAVG